MYRSENGNIEPLTDIHDHIPSTSSSSGSSRSTSLDEDTRSIDSNECIARFYKVKHFLDDSPKSFTRARRYLKSPFLRENSIRTVGTCCWAIYKYAYDQVK